MFRINKCYEAINQMDALGYLSNNKAVIINGGTDVLVNIRDNISEAINVLSIHNVQEIKYVRENNRKIYIGAGTTFSEIIKSPIIKNNIPYFIDALETIAGPQIRNMGTIGGNICNGVTSADSAPLLFCMKAIIHIESSKNVRKVPIEDFYLSFGKVDLKDDEMVTRIEIDKNNIHGFDGRYIKNAKRKSMDITILGIGVLLKVKNNVIEDIRIALGVASPIPMRCRKTENALKGKQIDSHLESMINETIVKEISPRDSWRASKSYRIQLVVTGIKRIIESFKEVNLDG